MQNLEQTLGSRRPPRLSPGDCGDAYALMQDRFQSPRARKRALALILIDQGARADVVLRRTGVGMKSQRVMLRRLAAHGVPAAIFGSSRRLDQRRYSVKAIAGVRRSCLASRPPHGAMSWNVVHLTTTVRKNVAGAETITKETVRHLLKAELGSESILAIDPYSLVQTRQQNAERHEHQVRAGGAQRGSQTGRATRNI